jgi:hypothetical protein
LCEVGESLMRAYVVDNHDALEDAFRCFMGIEIEVLVAGNCFLRKEEQNSALKQNYKDPFYLNRPNFDVRILRKKKPRNTCRRVSLRYCCCVDK